MFAQVIARKNKLRELFTERYEDFKTQAAGVATRAVDGFAA